MMIKADLGVFVAEQKYVCRGFCGAVGAAAGARFRRGEYSEILQKVFTKTFYHEVKMLAPWHFYEAVNVEGAETSAAGRMPRNIAKQYFPKTL